MTQVKIDTHPTFGFGGLPAKSLPFFPTFFSGHRTSKGSGHEKGHLAIIEHSVHVARNLNKAPSTYQYPPIHFVTQTSKIKNAEKEKPSEFTRRAFRLNLIKLKKAVPIFIADFNSIAKVGTRNE